MTDVLTRKKRSQVMAAIRSCGNKATELKLVALFRAQGIKGWRRGADLPGKPDFVFMRQRVAVFVDGCFWHGCRWHCRMPRSRVCYWRAKIETNRIHDKQVVRELKKQGWRVLRLWEHELANAPRITAKISRTLGDVL